MLQTGQGFDLKPLRGVLGRPRCYEGDLLSESQLRLLHTFAHTIIWADTRLRGSRNPAVSDFKRFQDHSDFRHLHSHSTFPLHCAADGAADAPWIFGI